MITFKLTQGQQKILQGLADGQELARGIDCNTGCTKGGWWMEDEEVSGKVCTSLLKLCFLRQENWTSQDMEYYTINEDGLRALIDSKFVPPILEAIENQIASGMIKICGVRYQ